MDDFFTVASFGTIASCVVAVVAIVNALRHAVNWGPRWFGLLLSIGTAIAALVVTANWGESKTASIPVILRGLIVLVNGCLIYTSAYGIQNTVIVQKGAELRGRPAKSTWRSAW